MLFQFTDALIYILWLVVATVVLTLVIYIAVIVVESKHKASDKKFMILLLAFITVLIIPIVLGAVSLVLGAIGDVIAGLRNLIDGGGQNYVVRLAIIIGFLILLILTKYLVDLPWDNAVWVTLLVLFVLYIMFSLLPELYTFLGFAL
ncbi:MAG: conserved membrane protein of unknown function [Promethearchaeota archaeon]|nr:MAG: conserved membrane protein of unknown function [Candidatus Lokiarchaeota archaeon]